MNCGHCSSRLSTITMVVVADIVCRWCCSATRLSASRPSNGSSMISSSGLQVSARTSMTFLDSPVESFRNARSCRVCIPNFAHNSSASDRSLHTDAMISDTGVPSVITSIMSASSLRRSASISSACASKETIPMVVGNPLTTPSCTSPTPDSTAANADLPEPLLPQISQ